MPYYAHHRDDPPHWGRVFDAQSDAVQAMDKKTEKVSFVPTAEEKIAWRKREQARFNSGKYKPVPWIKTLNLHKDHYVHMSQEKEGYVSYTKNEEHGVQARHTVVRPGKYLEEFYSDHWNKTQRDKFVAMCQSDYFTLRIATTPDEIEKCYTHGPSSCMSHPPSHFDSKLHPSRVYGDSDLALAYIGTNGAVDARAICWPEKKIYGRLYGNTGVLQERLHADGWKNGSLVGARIKAVALGDFEEYLMPYVDNIGKAEFTKDGYFLLGEGKFNTQTTNGITYIHKTCPHCKDNFRPREFKRDEGMCQPCWGRANQRCHECAKKLHVYKDECYKRQIDGNYLCADCAKPKVCLACEKRFSILAYKPLTQATIALKKNHFCLDCHTKFKQCKSCDRAQAEDSWCVPCDAKIDMALMDDMDWAGGPMEYTESTYTFTSA